MNKVVFQGVVIVLMFFLTWFVLRQIDWINVFKIEKAVENTEEKLGDVFWDLINKSEKNVDDEFVINSLDSILSNICSENKIDTGKIKLHIISKDEVNAFALPNGHLVLYTGLILNSDNQEQLTGVIGHEMAHIQLNHVMKKLIKEVGLSILVSMATGNDPGLISQTVKMLSSTAFDRNMEKQADLGSVKYLVKANIDPEPFADFLYKLSYAESDIVKNLSWISTHPDSKERAEYIIEYCKDKDVNNYPVLKEDTWIVLKAKLKDEK